MMDACQGPRTAALGRSKQFVQQTKQENRMLAKFSGFFTRQLGWACICLFLAVACAHGQSEISLNGAFDFRVHSSPDSIDRSIDADDVAQLAKEAGMRGIVLKNHWDSTAALAYMVRKRVPGLEVFGGVVLNRSVGGINIEAVKHMAAMKGGYGKVVWMPTMDSESFVTKLKENRPFVPVTKDGHLVPEVLELIDFMAQHPELVLETGHISGTKQPWSSMKRTCAGLNTSWPRTRRASSST